MQQQHQETAINFFLLFFSLSSSVALAFWSGNNTGTKTLDEKNNPSKASAFLKDANGNAVPLVSYQKIVSIAVSCDEILQQILSKPERVLAYTRTTQKSHPDRHLFQSLHFYHQTSLEELLSWKPDLVLVAGHTDISFVLRLREAGIAVFNVGECRGVPDYLKQIQVLGTLLQEEDRAKQYYQRFFRRLNRIAPEKPIPNAPSVLYIGIYGNKMFGGGKNTSYHHIITYAGFRDAAAEADIDGYISYSVEKLLEMNPDIIICEEGMRPLIQKIPGALQSLNAVKHQKIYEFPGYILSSAASLMLVATEEVRASILGETF